VDPKNPPGRNPKGSDRKRTANRVRKGFSVERRRSQTVPNGQLKGDPDGESEDYGPVRTRESASFRCGLGPLPRRRVGEVPTGHRKPSREHTVRKTNTGGEVRNALRLMENEDKGTRPIRSVTSGEGELVWMTDQSQRVGRCD
jgi:hypothetical protein